MSAEKTASDAPQDFAASCPIPIADYPSIILAHGGGGKLMHQLLEKMLLPAFGNEKLNRRHDGAILDGDGSRFAFTTDSYVVKPIFFPGGDIGRLAVHGTVNDLAMCGARPRHLSAALILEEGLPMETLWRIVRSMKEAAEECGVEIVTGDTKVVDRGKGDGIFINTAGVGVVERDIRVGPDQVREGDAVILSGDVGRHGVAIMAEREGLAFESTVESDCADLSGIVMDIIAAGIDVHCLRDCTRGGVGSAVIEISEAAGLGIHIEENAVPVCDGVRGACEILGLDPLYVANEGRFVAFVPAAEAGRVLEIMRAHATSSNAAVIGKATATPDRRVTITSAIGATRIMDMFSGEQLPRIC